MSFSRSRQQLEAPIDMGSRPGQSGADLDLDDAADAPGLSALLDEYMQEVAQANSLPDIDAYAGKDTHPFASALTSSVLRNRPQTQLPDWDPPLAVQPHSATQHSQISLAAEGTRLHVDSGSGRCVKLCSAAHLPLSCRYPAS